MKKLKKTGLPLDVHVNDEGYYALSLLGHYYQVNREELTAFRDGITDILQLELKPIEGQRR